MSEARQELEQQFLKLPTLKHIGMALMEYAETLFPHHPIFKDALGVFAVGYVRFEFPKDPESISIILGGVDVESIQSDPKGVALLPWPMLKQMRLENNQAGFACFVVNHAQFLGQAVLYMRCARSAYMEKRLIPPEGANAN